MTLSEAQKNHYHIELTTLKMVREESVISFLRHFTSAHKWAEQEGYQYNDNLLVDLVLGKVEKSDNKD